MNLISHKESFFILCSDPKADTYLILPNTQNVIIFIIFTFCHFFYIGWPLL